MSLEITKKKIMWKDKNAPNRMLYFFFPKGKYILLFYSKRKLKNLMWL